MSTAQKTTSWRISLRASVAVLFALLLVFGVPGCGGCVREDPIAKKKREDEEVKKKRLAEKEKPKPDFEFTKLITLPGENSDIGLDLNYAKPGHWITASQLIRANNFDFQADMASQLVDSNSKPLDVERTPYQITLSRPAALPKGQIKNFEVVLPMSRPQRSITSADVVGEPTKYVYLKNILHGTRGGAKSVEGLTEKITAMPEHQFHFTVLARDPDSYGFLKRTASVTPPSDEYDIPLRSHYRIQLPRFTTSLIAPLPSHSLTWSSIAYILWDGAPPNRLSPDQQQSLLDWIHWGGQLIISGPGSLDDLKGTFLDEYLPAETAKTIEFTASDFEDFNDYWSLPSVRKKEPQRLIISKKIPLIGVDLKPRADAEFLPHANRLAIEKRIGAGRIVVTAFPLNDSRVASWKNFDNFFNNGLLRRAPREFKRTNDNFNCEFGWATLPKASANDPRLVSTVRYFTRDLGHTDERSERQLYEKLSPAPVTAIRQRPLFTVEGSPTHVRSVGTHPHGNDWHFNGYSYSPDSGVAGWNDFSGTAHAVRTSLKKAAGITVPEAGFVLRILCIYLVILVPVNWGVFRAIGRVEWAWVAAPIIAIVGAIMVVRLAQLDIGFVRSRTELAVLELQGDYPRGHLTRYTALYTSLSSRYSLTYDDEAAVALPFSVDTEYVRSKESPRAITFRRDQTTRIMNFQVDSNSTSMLHTEQIVKPGGEFSLTGNDEDGWRLANGSELALQGVGVFRRTTEGKLERAWLGSLPPRTTASLRFKSVHVEADELFFSQWDDSPITGRDQDSKGEVNLSEVISLAINRLNLNAGDVRLVGYCDQDAGKFSQIVISPRIAQNLARTLVLCHLKRGPLPIAQCDRNCRIDFEDDVPEETETIPDKSGPDKKAPDPTKPQADPAANDDPFSGAGSTSSPPQPDARDQ